jgi:hypothetical protein
VAVKITVTDIEHKRSMGTVPAIRPNIVFVPPPGVSNWQRVSGPEEVPGGQRVILQASWQCLEPGSWRAIYSDGTRGYPVTAGTGPQGQAAKWRLHRGPKEIFEFAYHGPVNPRFIGEVVTFTLEMIVGSWRP